MNLSCVSTATLQSAGNLFCQHEEQAVDSFFQVNFLSYYNLPGKSITAANVLKSTQTQSRELVCYQASKATTYRDGSYFWSGRSRE